MDSKLLLIKIITLLFVESVIDKKGNSSSRNLAGMALAYVKMPDTSIISDFSRDPQVKLMEIVKWMMQVPPGEPFDRGDLLQRVRMATETEEYIYDALASIIQPESTEEEHKQTIKTAREYINQFINRATIVNILKDSYHQACFKPDTIDWDHFAKDLIGKLEPYKTTASAVKTSFIESVDFSDVEALKQAFADAKQALSYDGVLNFGLQGLNRMFGKQNGGRRGEFVVVGALQHNFKSGTSLEMLKGAALYNKPFMHDPSKKPLLLRISLENPALNDIIHLYRSIIEPEIGMVVDENEIDPIAAAIYVNEKLSVNGYHVKIDHYNPSDFTVFDLFDVIEGYENDGYEIHMLNIDYLAMMSTKGCKQGATGQDIRDLFRRTRNYTEAKKIFTVTPHQLSVDAKKLIRNGVDDFVRDIANKGYWDSCSTIDQEVDMEIYQHLVEVNGEKYITFQRGKHRKPGVTPHQDLYVVYKFAKVGFFTDDIRGPDLSRRRVAANTASEGGQTAWFDMAA